MGHDGEAAQLGQPALSGRPLLVIDGDSFAHRSYHALPKTIRRSDGTGARAILGFANFLLRFYAEEQTRAVIVGWDSLGAPTKRHEMFPAYQSGREFDNDLIEQLNVLPELVAACGFANAKATGFEADDFLSAAVAGEKRAGGAALVASGDRDAFQLASPCTTVLYPSRGGEISRIGPEEVRQRYGVDPKQVRTSLRSAAILPENCLTLPGLGQNVQRNWCGDTARLMASLTPVSSQLRRRRYASTD
jgi:DNA polymerase I